MQWWSGIVLVTIYFFCWEASPLQHNLTYLKFISAGLIDKKNKQTNKQTKKLKIYLSFVKLYFSSTFNYVKFSHINLDI